MADDNLYVPWLPDYYGPPRAVVQVREGRVNFIGLHSGDFFMSGIEFNGVLVGGHWNMDPKDQSLRWRFHYQGDITKAPLEEYALMDDFNVASREMPDRQPYRMPRVWYNVDPNRRSMLVEVFLRVPPPRPIGPCEMPPPPPPRAAPAHDTSPLDRPSTVHFEEVRPDSEDNDKWQYVR
jgi:hypothetical protein